jgi:hypothetical protein
VIDAYRKHFNVNQCLQEIDVRHLLPTRRTSSMIYDDSCDLATLSPSSQTKKRILTPIEQHQRQQRVQT